MGTVDALVVIDMRLMTLEVAPGVALTQGELAETLREVRNALTKDPQWSDVVESNLRTQLAAAEARADAAVAEAAEEQRNHEAAEGRLREERERARATAVRLEQDLALSEVGIGRRAL